jgi:hypothetical protein
MADATEKRKTRRFPIGEMGILVSTNGKQEITPIRLVDVSMGGFGLMINTLPPSEKHHTLRYSILHKDFMIPVSIRWVQETDEGYRIGCGRFDEVGAAAPAA